MHSPFMEIGSVLRKKGAGRPSTSREVTEHVRFKVSNEVQWGGDAQSTAHLLKLRLKTGY